jgi:hypothetical protein
MPHHRIFAMACAPALLGAALIPVFAATLLVGPARTYKVPSAVAGVVNDGDTVLIDAGTYVQDVAIWTKNNLTLRGTAKYAHLQGCSGECAGPGKAIWVIQGNNTTIENIMFSDARVKDKNGAGIRQEGDNVTIRFCYFHNDEDGILGGGGSTSNVVIENTEFDSCGYGDGQSHNMYIGNVGSFTLKFCYSHWAKEGHLVKSRAKVNYALYNRLTGEPGDTASYELSFPDGGNAYIVGNIIEQSSTTHNSGIIDYASEHLLYGDAKALYVVNNTVVNHRNGGTFVQFASGVTTVRIVNNLFVGSGSMLSRPADTSHNIQTTNAAFVNEAGFDYRLTSASPGINKGIDPGSADGFSLMPVFQYVHPMSSQARTIIGGAIDIGAYEFGSAAIIHPPIELARGYIRISKIAGEFFLIDGRQVPERSANAFASKRNPAVIFDAQGHRLFSY